MKYSRNTLLALPIGLTEPVRGIIRQINKMARLLLLALGLVLCAVPTAQTIGCPSLIPGFAPSSSRRITETSGRNWDACYEMETVYEAGRIGLFVGNNPINFWDPFGLADPRFYQLRIESKPGDDFYPGRNPGEGFWAFVLRTTLNTLANPSFQNSMAIGGPGSNFGGALNQKLRIKCPGAKTPRQLLDALPTGKQSHVRTVKTEADLKVLHEQLTTGGNSLPPGSYPGTVTKLPDGTIIRMRPTSKSGGSTIDITYPDGKLGKVHIE